jgi:hypothetical protein
MDSNQLQPILHITDEVCGPQQMTEHALERNIYRPKQDKTRWRPKKFSEDYGLHEHVNIADDIKIRSG